MSLKFAAIGNLMVLSALENRARVEERFTTFATVELYDPLLALIGRGRREARPASRETVESDKRAADQARW
jgi:hypothetical protein